MQDVEDIYREFGPKFCLCPFLGAFYQTNNSTAHHAEPPNTITPCSVTDWDARDNKFNIINTSMIDSLNSPVWKDLRRQFASGEFGSIPSCRTCIDTERLGGHSPRMGANQHFAHHTTSDLIAKVRNIIENDFHVDEIISLDWFPSNYCNYSCIMCSGGASSSRKIFEIRFQKTTGVSKINAVDQDFFKVLRQVEIINFTGGETLMQPQVLEMLQYLVDNDMAANKTIFFLTNCSRYPDDIKPYFDRFRKVIFLCSIDGVGATQEYQRRNSVWNNVATNSLRMFHDPKISTVGNFVLTAVNALDVMDFVEWMDKNGVYDRFTVSPVFRAEHLYIDAMPPRLRDLAMERIQQRRHLFPRHERFIQAAHDIIASAQFNPRLLEQFREWIQLEDQDSHQPLREAVPEWASYL